MRLHPREIAVKQARLALSDATLEWQKTDTAHELTDAEYVSVVTDVLGDMLLGWAKYAIRMERHGDPEREGGLE